MKKNEENLPLCFKVPNSISRKKVQKNINSKYFQGAYGAKSCNCACSCTDGY